MTTPAAESQRALLKEQGKATVGRVCHELTAKQVPMISQILRIIKDLSGRAESLSVNDLVDFIGSEPATMGKVISIANTVGYNTRGVEIVSIHHAVSLIGFNRVRTLAISVLLLEGTQSKFTAESNRELAGAALVSGLVAAEMCRLGVAADADLAFICGALRGYGRMLAATFLPVEYAEAVKLIPREGAERSFEMIFGLTALELGREVLWEMKVPAAILNSFENVSRFYRPGEAMNAATTLVGVADFGQRTAELLQAGDLTSVNFETRLAALSATYDFPVKLARSDVLQLLNHIIGVLECFRYQAGTYISSVMIFRRVHALVAETPLPNAFGTLFKDVPAAKPAAAAEDTESYDI